MNYSELRAQLIADRQVLSWNRQKHTSPLSVDLKTLSGIVADDTLTAREGFDSISQSTGPFVGDGYRHDSNAGKGLQHATYTFNIEKSGHYDLQFAWSAHPNRATNVPVTVTQRQTSHPLVLNQRESPGQPPFGSAGTFQLKKGVVTVRMENAGTDGYVILDAARLVPIPGSAPAR